MKTDSQRIETMELTDKGFALEQHLKNVQGLKRNLTGEKRNMRYEKRATWNFWS